MAPLPELPDDILDLLSKSKAAAKEKDYGTALNVVNEALKLGQSLAALHVSTLLDFRHVIHVRHDDLQSAIKDAKSMIRLDRKDARGYIRCGQVEGLRGDKTAALTYLQHARRNCAPSDPNVALVDAEIKKFNREIETELVLSKSRDPFSTLPLEIIQFILSYVAHRQHVRMLRVCRSWKRVLVQLPPLVDTLSFPGAQIPITPKMLLAALRRLKVPKTIEAINMTPPCAQIFENRAQKNFKSVQAFSLHGSSNVQLNSLPLLQWNLKTVQVGSGLVCDIVWVSRLIESCSSLKVAHFEGVYSHGPYLNIPLCSQSLVDLKVTFEVQYMKTLDIDMPRLERLHLARLHVAPKASCLATAAADLRHLAQLQNLTLYDCVCQDLLLPSSIKHLELHKCEYDCHWDEESVPLMTNSPFPALDNLETLTFIQCRTTSSRPTEFVFLEHAAFKTRPGHLSTLTLGLCPDQRPLLLLLLKSPWTTDLKTLKLDTADLKDNDAQLLVESCPELQSFHVISQGEISGVLFADMINAPASKIRKVVIEKCPKVSRDILPWAEARGIKIQYITESTGKLSGKTVREYH